MDRADGHTANRLVWPANISPLHLPPYSPELNPIEVWLHLRERRLSYRLFYTCDAVWTPVGPPGTRSSPTQDASPPSAADDNRSELQGSDLSLPWPSVRGPARSRSHPVEAHRPRKRISIRPSSAPGRNSSSGTLPGVSGARRRTLPTRPYRTRGASPPQKVALESRRLTILDLGARTLGDRCLGFCRTFKQTVINPKCE